MRPRASVARILLLLLLCATVCAQSAAAASEHSHQDPSQHCCGLCHIGSLPFIQPSISEAGAPAVSIAWLEFVAPLEIIHEPPVTAGGSRAPPA